MPKLDDEALKEVGRFAIRFRYLDEMITEVATRILGCTEQGIAQHLTGHLTEGRKLDWIETICKILATAHGLLDTSVHNTFLEKIKLAKDIVERRNAVIHSEVKKKGGKATVQSKKDIVVELTPEALSVETDKIEPAADALVDAYTEFMHGVKKARAGDAAVAKE